LQQSERRRFVRAGVAGLMRQSLAQRLQQKRVDNTT
jgi:hypothetical protein